MDLKLLSQDVKYLNIQERGRGSYKRLWYLLA